MKGKKEVRISTLNVQTLRTDEKVHELVASAEKFSQDVICIQEHRFMHEDLPTKEHTIGSWKLITCSAWKNKANAAIGGIGILLNTRAYSSISSIEIITNRIMITTFHGNPQTTLICCYSPTNVSDEDEVDNFYEALESITKQIPKHNMLIIGGDFNSHLGKLDSFKNSFQQQTNRNGSKMKDYLLANNLVCLNTTFMKRIGQLWTHKSPNGSHAQLDYILINRKWRNSAKNCRAYNSFVSVSSDHRIVTAQISLTLRANKKKSTSIPSYDWSVLKHNDNIASSFAIEVKNRFSILQESQESVTADKSYKSFETACREAAAAVIPQKTRVKKRKPWENDNIGKERQHLHQAQQVKDSSPTTENINRFKEAQISLKEAYKLEKTNYLERKISQIRTSATNKQSAEAWKTINEITGRKSSNCSRLKANDQEERIELWKNHFEDLLGKPPQVANDVITPVVKEELNIAKGDFTMEELTKP